MFDNHVNLLFDSVINKILFNKNKFNAKFFFYWGMIGIDNTSIKIARPKYYYTILALL